MKIKKNRKLSKAARIFTDREDLRKAFWKQYEKKQEELKSGDNNVRVLNYYGFGGIGKTALLKKLIEELEERLPAPLYVSYDFETAIDLRTALSSLKNQLVRKYKYEFPLFDIGLYFYAQKCGEKASLAEKESLIGGSSLLSLVFSVADNLPGVSVVTKILSTIDEAAAFGRTKVYLKKHEPLIRQLEYMEREAVYQKLPELFSQDLERNLEQATQPLVIFLDTYELLVNEMSSVGEPLVADKWLRGENGPVQNVSKLLWVIAGREKLKWNRFDKEWDSAIDSHILGTLSQQDSAFYLRSAGIADELLCRQLYALTDGTPVYLDLCVACFEKLLETGRPVHIAQFGQDSTDLIERFVRYMDDAQKDLVYMTACLDKWNDDLFMTIAPQVLPGFSYTTYGKLKEYSFVSAMDNGYYSIHHTIGKVLVEKSSGIIKSKTANAMIGHFSGILKEADPFSAEYFLALVYLVRAGLLLYPDRDAHCEFYKDQVESYLLGLIVTGRSEDAKAVFDLLLPEAEKCREDLLYAYVLRERVFYFRATGDYQTANRLARESCELYQKLLGQEHPDTLGAASRLASTMSDLGNYRDAQALFRETIEKQKALLGADHPDTLTSMNNLALALASDGQTEAALALLQEVYENEKSKQGEDHPNTLTVESNIASMLCDLGRSEESLQSLQALVEKHKTVFGENHPSTFILLNNISRALFALGRYEEALELEQDLLERRKKHLGQEHPMTLATLNDLAVTLLELGKYEDALPLAEALLELRKRLQGDDHPDTLTVMNNLATTYSRLHKHEEAFALHQQILQQSTDKLGAEHPDTLMTVSTLSCVLVDLGRWEEAVESAKRAAEKIQHLLGKDNPRALTAAHNLGLVLAHTGRLEEALQTTEDLLEKDQRILGEEHPDTLTTMRNLVGILFDMEQTDRAYQLAEALLEKRTRVHGEDHPATLDAMNQLGSILYALEKYEETRVLTEELLERRRQVLGEDHPDTLTTMENLMTTLLAMEENEKALEFAPALLEKQIKLLGSDHPNTQYTQQFIHDHNTP